MFFLIRLHLHSCLRYPWDVWIIVLSPRHFTSAALHLQFWMHINTRTPQWIAKNRPLWHTSLCSTLFFACFSAYEIAILTCLDQTKVDHIPFHPKLPKHQGGHHTHRQLLPQPGAGSGWTRRVQIVTNRALTNVLTILKAISATTSPPPQG